MNVARGRFARIALGHVERLITMVSREAALFEVRVRLHAQKRSIPSLLMLGEAGLAESLGEKPATVRRCLQELQAKGAMMVDARHRLVYAVGAIDADPPTTAQSVIAMARQWLELPSCPIKDEVSRALSGALMVPGREKLAMEWARHQQLQSTILSTADREVDCNSQSTSLPYPFPSPRSENRSRIPSTDPETDNVPGSVSTVNSNGAGTTTANAAANAGAAALELPASRFSLSENERAQNRKPLTEIIEGELSTMLPSMTRDELKSRICRAATHRGVRYDGHLLDVTIAAVEARRSKQEMGA